MQSNPSNNNHINHIFMRENDLIELRSDVKDIKDALLGGGTHKDKGILDRLTKTETRISTLERVFWLALGGGSVIVFVLNVIIK